MNFFNIFKTSTREEKNKNTDLNPIRNYSWKKTNPSALTKISNYLFIDVSGSVREDEIEDFVTKVDVDPSKVIYFNTSINPIHHAGGTNFQCVIDEAKIKNLDKIFIFTDGAAMLPPLGDLKVTLLILKENKDINDDRDWNSFKVEWV